MRLKNTLKFMFHLFCTITTAQVLFVSFLTLIGKTSGQLSFRDLYSIPLTALVGTLPTFIFVLTENASRTRWFIMRFIHFILTTGLVFAALTHFGQLRTETIMPIASFFFIFYFSVHLYQEIQAKKTADELNKRIFATHKD